MKITKYSIKYRIATTAIAVALLVLGLYGFSNLSVNFLPDITYPMIKVHIWWRGATPYEIDKSIADPVERQMATVDDLDYLESSSIEGMYTLLVNFKYGVDVNIAYQDALAAMARVARDLPPDIDPPIVIKADPSQLPIMQMTVKSDRWDLVQLRTWADEWLQDQMLSVQGVAGAEIVGGLKKEIRIHLDPEVLEQYELTVSQIAKRLSEENIEQFGGRITAGNREIIARTAGEYKTLDEIGSVVILSSESGSLYLRDIAKIEDSHEEARVITRLNSEAGVKLSILKQSTANTVEVAKAVTEKIAGIHDSLPEGVELGIVENQADYVDSALQGVAFTALQAALLLILIIYLFLGSWRQILVMILSLPVTLIINFGLMNLSGFSLNIFSLGGLVIAIGILLDNSTVVLENITRRKRAYPDEEKSLSIEKSTIEVGTPVIAATISFLALFLPFLLVQGLTTLLFRELILVIAGIVVISLLVALSVTPMFSSIFMDFSSKSKEGWFEKFFDKVTILYGKALQKALRFKLFVVGLFLVVLLGAVLLLSNLGSEFLPPIDDGRIMVKVRMPTGTALEVTDNALKDLESAIKNDPLIESYFTLAGGKVWGLYTYEIANEGEINIQLLPRNQRAVSTEEFVKKLRPIISKVELPIGRAMVMQMRVRGIRRLGDADIEVKVKGQNIEELYSLSTNVLNTMRKLDSFRNTRISLDMTKPEYQIVVDRTKAYSFGIPVKEVSDTVHALITGTVSTKFRENDEYYNIRVTVPEKEMVSRKNIENIPVRTSSGKLIRIKDVAEVIPSVGPVELIRDNQIKQVVVQGDVEGKSIGEALGELQGEIERSKTPQGYEISYGGQAQMMDEMQKTIMSVLLFALFFAFVVLVVQFNTLKLPSIILGSVPFCLSGLVFIMYLTSMPLGATVIIGLLIVVSATINDGVLLLSFAEELMLNEKLSKVEAVITAAKIRLRPRVMTTASTLIGLVPLALNFQDGGDLLQPMAIAAIGGLLMEMGVALFLMPVLFVIVTKNRLENIQA